MDLISPIIDVVSRLCGCISNRVIHIRELEANLRTLRTSSDELTNVRNDVMRRVENQEANQLMQRTYQVAGWLLRADDKANEVNDILTEGRKDIENRCLGSCCPRNCYASYKLGKEVERITREVHTLRDEGRGYNHDIVAESLPPPRVQEMATVPTTGMDDVFQRACNCISEEGAGIIGIYGTGGVGKTTLLQKINNEFLPSRTPIDFDVVFWVTVSKEIDMLKIQKRIVDRLELPLPENGSLADRAEKLYSVLSKKKFVLLLDDIWDRVNLTAIGIPLPNIDNKSKVLFTTRDQRVCGKMGAQKKIEVECLDGSKAWKLFEENVGQGALNLNSDPQILALAQDVAKECDGLPLALITIGRAMASKKTRQEWEHAATILKNSASEFPGITDEVFRILKFSYDSLSDDTIKSCFLYCSLFPEDSSISIDKKLIPYWIGEGFLGTFDDIDDARNRGYDIVGILKQACLLETSDGKGVKMHDVLRDLALWIGCDCGRQKDKFLVRAGIGLREAPEVWKWREAERISLMDNDIEMLEDDAPTCPNLLTLILSENRKLCRISDGFFQYMNALRVLDLSRTRIKELPRSIAELVELQYLDLSHTKIRELPGEIKKLVKLKCLNLGRTEFLESIPSGTLSRLSKLQWFDIVYTAFDVSEAFLKELECLKDLKYLSIWIRKAASVKRLLDSNKFMRCTLRLHISGCNDLTSLSLSSNIEYIQVCNCNDLTSLSLPNSSNLEYICARDCKNLKVICGGALDGYFPKLRKVYIWNCNELEDLSWIRGAPNLKNIDIWNAPKLTWLCGVGGIATGCFTNLKYVHIRHCPGFKDLSWLRGAPNLHKLEIRDCNTLDQQYKDGVMAEYLPTGCQVYV